MLLLCIIELVLSLRGEAFELYTDQGMTRALVAADGHFFAMDLGTAAANGTRAALFRPQGNRLFVGRSPICARNTGRNDRPIKNAIEICRYEEPNDVWTVKKMGDAGTVMVWDKDGENCLSYDASSPAGMVFSAPCSSGDLGHHFFARRVSDVQRIADRGHKALWAHGLKYPMSLWQSHVRNL